MIKNYFKIAWRNIKSQNGYATINIVGLAIGIAACMLILQFIAFELSYEDFHVKKDRIYRVQQDRYDNGKLSTQWAAGAIAAGNSFKAELPEIEDFVKLVPFNPIVAEVNSQPIKIPKSFFATNSFFSVFSYPLVAGDSSTALTEPFTAAISEKIAGILFGNENPVGKTIKLNQRSDYKINFFLTQNS